MPNFTDPNKKENYFFSQPHQPFFLFGILWALALMVLFAISYKLLQKGEVILTLMPSTFHAYGLIYIVISQFFIGFLYTTFPRFCQTDTVSKAYYALTFALYQMGALLFVAGAFLSQTLLMLGMFTLFVAMFTFFVKLLNIYNKSKNPVKEDQLWILISLAFGVITHALAIYETYFAYTLYALQFSFTIYVTFLTFSVAQRMVPFFSHSLAEKKRYFLPLAFAGFALKSITQLAELPWATALIDIFLALFLLREFLRWKLNFKQAPAILKILHIALFWLPIGLFVGAVASIIEQLTQSSFVFLELHLIALGFVLTMLIGFGTRVTLGHSGQPPHADSATLKIFYLTQLLVGVRFLFSIAFGLNSEFFWVFDLSIMMWMVLFGFWSWKFAPTLILGAREV